MSLKEIKETVEASSELANTRGSVITKPDLSPEDQAEIYKLFDPNYIETKEEREWIKGMEQLMAYKNPKGCNSQRCNIRKKKNKN